MNIIKHKRTKKWALRGLTAVAMLSGIPMVMGSSPLRVGRYDFSYLTNGDPRALPVQVFDDGKSTFFQFRPGENIPVIFAQHGQDIELATGAFEGPYVKVNDLSGRFVTQNGKSQGNVIYGGVGRETVPITVVSPSGLKTPYAGVMPQGRGVLVASINNGPSGVGAETALDKNSYATPIKGDRVQWHDSELRSNTINVLFEKGKHTIRKPEMAVIKSKAAALTDATRIVIIGREDDTLKEGLDTARASAIRMALIKLGVDESKIHVKTGVASESATSKLHASDIVLERVVPTQISRPEINATASADPKADYVRSQVNSWVKSGVITPEAGMAILTRAGQAPQQTQRSPSAAIITSSQTIASPDRPLDGFDFKATDRSISNTIKRWANATNYQIVWDLPTSADAPITGDGQINAATMREAMEKIAAGMKKKGYQVAVTIYSNRVIRFAEAEPQGAAK